MAVMTKKIILSQLDALPKEGLREVADFIAFIKNRYQPSDTKKRIRKVPIGKESFVGMWKDRQDMQDSVTFVKHMRENEWKAK